LNDPISFLDPEGKDAEFEGGCDGSWIYIGNGQWACADESGPGFGKVGTGIGGNTGTGGGGPPALKQNRELLPDAKERAIAALGTKDCFELFGTEKTRSGGFNPVDLLNSLVEGGEFGQIKFENTGAGWGVAKTSGGLLGVLGMAGRVTITINSSNDDSLYWNDGDTNGTQEHSSTSSLMRSTT